MRRTSIAREDVKHFKTLGLLGEIFQLSMKMKKAGEKILPLHLGDPPQFDFPTIPGRNGVNPLTIRNNFARRSYS